MPTVRTAEGVVGVLECVYEVPGFDQGLHEFLLKILRDVGGWYDRIRLRFNRIKTTYNFTISAAVPLVIFCRDGRNRGNLLILGTLFSIYFITVVY